jgi:predicted nucleic acid-binding protein
VWALSAEESIQVLTEAAATSVVGGSIHDALIAGCAEKAHADAILTFNERHFRRFASPTLEIVVRPA